jgi:ABC-type branched-subunit amino acid transport system ATPase component
LDEPAAGVNPVIRKRLVELLLRLKEKGETILLIEHDMDFVRATADYVIVMDQGAVLTEGLPDVVLKEKKVLEAYLGK